MQSRGRPPHTPLHACWLACASGREPAGVGLVGGSTGYARVSTADQKLDLQRDELKRAGCRKLFTDVARGSLVIVVSVVVPVASPIVVIAAAVDAAVPLPVLRRPAMASFTRRRRVGSGSYEASREGDRQSGYEEQACSSHDKPALQWACEESALPTPGSSLARDRRLHALKG
ncbi:MAG: hypothetical protein E6J90_42910 [Deltaproteobacteria bacterium]|nr:MAG: hypothetical protein E6J91_38365 [Deltaproteobacteria bacterium]TMQ07691.1 MAG: hypothetical protein E6J90_42910 [Deltaproteobacteria bacterium]